MQVFHLAIPTHDLDLAEKFYINAMGAEKARRYDDRVTFNFFDHQIVCHLFPEKINKTIEMYPNHFGMTFDNKEDFYNLYNKIKESGFKFFKDKFTRFGDKPETHETFFIADLSNNLLEFKYYDDNKYMY